MKKELWRTAAALVWVWLFLFVSTVEAADLKGYDVEVILDSSGSMAENLGGKSKMDIAKEAIQSVVNEVPAGSFFGFRAYGHQSGREAKNCTDSELIVPIGPIDKSSFMSKVNVLQPRGWTPIDYSLRQAKNDFSDKSEFGKMIILVSDGEETCGGDPCQAVKDLKAAGFNVTVNAVGFSVGAVAREQLKCIAAATGGEYKDANNAAELTEGMRVFSKRAFQGYTPSGAVVPGTGFGNAPLVTPGIYGGDLLTNESKFYKFNVRKGQKVDVSVSIKKERAMIDHPIDGECVCMVTTLVAYGSDMSEVGIKKASNYEYTGIWKGSNPEDSSQYCIKASDISPKAYSFSYDVPKGGENYVSVSMGWKGECTTNYAAPQNNKASRDAEDLKKSIKAFYDIKITIEGEGEAGPVAPGKSKKMDDADSVTGESDKITSPNDVPSLTGSMLPWIIGSVILLGILAAVVFVVVKRGGGAGLGNSGPISFNDGSTPSQSDPAQPTISASSPFSESAQASQAAQSVQPTQVLPNIPATFSSPSPRATIDPVGIHPGSVSGVKVCHMCGKGNMPDAGFCGSCGQKI